MGKSTFVFIFLFCSTITFSQNSRVWATYYGGIDTDLGYGVACDGLGNVYLCGTSASSGLSQGGYQNTNMGASDAFLVKFDGAGNRIWATYFGSTVTEEAVSVTVDIFGNVYLAGNTNSTNGIASGGFQNTYGGGNHDAFLVKFNSAGNFLWSTYYGGPLDDNGLCVTTDNVGNVFLSGWTNSSSGIYSGGFQSVFGGGLCDAFLVKFDATGNRIWATYYGENFFERGMSIATDNAGAVYMAGTTNSFGGIASGGFQNTYGGGPYGDAFLVKFDANGNRLWATYYGGTNDDYGFATATDLSGNVYLTGLTVSTNAISSGGFQNTYGGGTTFGDAFLAKFNSSGNRLWGTYYGGTDNDEGEGIQTDLSGNVFLGGGTYSTNAIASFGFQSNLIGSEDEFIAAFDSSGNRSCATYFGHATLSDDEFGAVAIDGQGNIYLVGRTESTTGIASGGFQNIYGGGTGDAVLVKFTTCSRSISANVSSTSLLCNGDCNASLTPVINGGTSPYTFSWSNGQTNLTATALCSGSYTLFISDAMGDTVSTVGIITEPPALQINSTVNPVTFGGSTQLSVNVAGTYQWSPATGLSCTTCSNTIATPNETTTYCVSVLDSNGCTYNSCIIIEVKCNDFFVPNSFSPNNDGVNDILFVRSECIQDLNFKIYDRIGEKVFETTDKSLGWDGSYKGEKLNSAVFVYVATITFTDGTTKIIKGDVYCESK